LLVVTCALYDAPSIIIIIFIIIIAITIKHGMTLAGFPGG